MSIAPDMLRQVVEGALMAAGKPMSIAQLQQLFEEHERPGKSEFEAAFEDIQADCQERGFELKEVASGWRFQVKQDLAKYIGKMWEEKPQKYSRALLETLALIAYRQPITRGDIEQIRGVAVSSQIIKTLQERGWVKVVGHRDVPGRPAMYATTREFLDYFNLKSLEELPSLSEIKDLDSLNEEFNLDISPEEYANATSSGEFQDEADEQEQSQTDMVGQDQEPEQGVSQEQEPVGDREGDTGYSDLHEESEAEDADAEEPGPQYSEEPAYDDDPEAGIEDSEELAEADGFEEEEKN